MDSSSAPGRLRLQPSWLLSQCTAAARGIVGRRMSSASSHRYHYSMLSALEEFGPASQTSLGRRCGIDRSDVTAAVGEVADAGLLERFPDPADRRRNIVQITDSGRAHLTRLDAELADAQAELLAPLSAAERATLVGLLTRLVDHHAGLAGEQLPG